MICIARIFGAPLTVPTGSETRRASNAVIPSASWPVTFVVMCMTWLYRSTVLPPSTTAQPLAGDELEDVAGLDVLLPLPDRLLERRLGEVALVLQRQRLPRVDLPELARRRLLQPLHDVVDPPAGVLVGDLDRARRFAAPL